MACRGAGQDPSGDLVVSGQGPLGIQEHTSNGRAMAAGVKHQTLIIQGLLLSMNRLIGNPSPSLLWTSSPQRIQLPTTRPVGDGCETCEQTDEKTN